MKCKSTFIDCNLLKEIKESGKWISQNSAILVFHGIGDQKPFETLDSFVRGTLKTYESAGFEKEKFIVNHDLVKHTKGDNHWYENIIRVYYEGEDGYYLDFYEFYWADKTEDKVSWSDMQDWVNTIVKGATEFYDKKKERGNIVKDNSLFFQDGVFKKGLYRTSLKFATITIPLFEKIVFSLVDMVRYTPIVGDLLYRMFNSKSKSKKLTNVLGDIVAYNSPDPKNKLFKTRREIQKEASIAIQNLIEAKDNITYKYNKIIIAAHSLGTQIAFDGLNSIDHKVALKDIKRKNINAELFGFITFGSHLDKAAFFFTEQTKNENYIKAQIRNNFYAFKRCSDLKIDDSWFEVQNIKLKSTLSDIPWRNYYDINDPVSGELDYYDKVTNIRCDYVSSAPKNKKSTLFYLRHLYPFTHSYYWDDDRIYRDMIIDYLN